MDTQNIKESVLNCKYDAVFEGFEGIALFFKQKNYIVNFSKLSGELEISYPKSKMILSFIATKISDQSTGVLIKMKFENEIDEEPDMNPELTKIISSSVSYIENKYSTEYLSRLFLALSNFIERTSNLETDLQDIDFEQMIIDIETAEKKGYQIIVFYIIFIMFFIIMLVLGLRSAHF